MNTFLILLMVSLALLAFVAWIASRPRGSQLRAFANVAEGRYPGKKSYYTDAAHSARKRSGARPWISAKVGPR